MIHVSFNKRIFPDFLKVAIIIPIHIKGEKLDPNHYRPSLFHLKYTVSVTKSLHQDRSPCY